jgi:transcriptional regulator NrdR family protein
MQLQVIKADGSKESYLHTKVIATFVNAFVEPAEKNTFLASQLAESVTYYLYNNYDNDTITSSEIFSIIKAVLSSTGFDVAAQVLAEHNYRRNLLRARVQVIKAGSARIAGLSDNTQPWNKSKIINSLIAEQNLDSASARTIASLVEEKILNSGFHLVPADFVKFLVNWLMQSFVDAQQQNSASDNLENIIENSAVRDDRLRQPQNGLCKVEA